MAKNNKTYNQRRAEGIPSDVAKRSQKVVDEYKEYKALFNSEKLARSFALDKTVGKITTKEINTALRETQEQNKFLFGRYAGSFTKEEKKSLRQDLKQGNISSFKEKTSKGAFDIDSREAQLKRWVRGEEAPPKHVAKAIEKESKLLVGLDADPTSSAGWSSWKLQYLYGYSPKEAREIVKNNQRRDNPNEVNGSPSVWAS